MPRHKVPCHYHAETPLRKQGERSSTTERVISMKTNKKKRLTVSLLAVVTVLALVLTGCGAENAAEHNKYLKDEVLNSQTVDKETSSADKEDKSDKDKTSASEADKNSSKSDDKKNSDKSDNKNTGSSSSGSSSSSSSSNKKPSTGSGSTGNSGSSSSSGSSKPSTGGGNSGSSSKPTEPTNPPTEPSKPEHHCSFDIWVPPVMDTREVKVPYTVEVPIYEKHYWYECKKCGAQFDNDTKCAEHCVFVCNSTYTLKYENVLVRTEEKTEYRIETETYEKEPGYYKCSCGAHQ